MKLLFSIGGAMEVKSPQPVLSIRIGPAHLCFSVSDIQTNELHQLFYYSTDIGDKNAVSEIEKAHPEILNDFYQVLVGFDYPTSCFVPSYYAASESGKNLIGIMYGKQPGQHFHSEQTASSGIWNLYSVPEQIFREVNTRFSRARYWQQYTVESMNLPQAEVEELIMVEFRPESFSIFVCKKNVVLLVQTYDYTSPSEVIYYLLNVCKHFQMDQRKVQLLLSGLVAKESSLYHELYQYFINIEFRLAAWKITGTDSPAHFFTALNDLSKCAS